jgi:hypothetical protein
VGKEDLLDPGFVQTLGDGETRLSETDEADGERVRHGDSLFDVIPAKAGIQEQQMIAKLLDPGFRRGDDVAPRVSPR